MPTPTHHRIIHICFSHCLCVCVRCSQQIELPILKPPQKTAASPFTLRDAWPSSKRYSVWKYSSIEALCLQSRLLRPLRICSTYSIFECTIELTLIIIYREMLPHSLLNWWLYYVFNLFLWQRMYNWNVLLCCQFRCVAFTEDAYFTVCGCSPCPFFHEVFYRRDKSVVTSASPQAHTHKNRHTLAHTLTQTWPRVITLGQAFINLGWRLILLIA